MKKLKSDRVVPNQGTVLARGGPPSQPAAPGVRTHTREKNELPQHKVQVDRLG